MARKFLYLVALATALLIAGAILLVLFSDRATRIAFVPSAKFAEPGALTVDTYADPAMWIARPGLAQDPSRWRPKGTEALPPLPEGAPKAEVFFVHPTSLFDSKAWNAALGDADARARAAMLVRGIASAFGDAGEVWAPRYRQATLGAFLTEEPQAQQAIDAAYRDVALAFDAFLTDLPPDAPIVLAGHSQGALHVLRLYRDRVKGHDLAARVAAVYAVGWPISIAHDLPVLGLHPCATADEPGCLIAYSSFAEPADPSSMLKAYFASKGFDGKVRGEGPVLCVNPLTGTRGASAGAALNLGTLKPNAEMTDGELVPSAVPARCDGRGLLLIGDPPNLGPYTFPGNNYHVYDVPLFWANLRADVSRRLAAWDLAH